MRYLSLTIPGIEKPIDSGLPVPTGGLFNGDKPGIGASALQAFVNLILIIAVLTSLYFLIQGGIDIIQSEGKKDKLNRGREKAIYAVFGLIMIFLSFLFINAISAFLGYDLLCMLSSSCK